MNKIKILALAALAGATVIAIPATPVSAQTGATPIRVQFAKGASSKTIKATIKGDQSKAYVLRLGKGQRLSVKMTATNGSNYFNIWAPGSDTAMFIGSTEGNEYVGVVPQSGDYKIDVYLMRNAARRNEASTFTLTVGAR
jgi:hypothetical protein